MSARIEELEEEVRLYNVNFGFIMNHACTLNHSCLFPIAEGYKREYVLYSHFYISLRDVHKITCRGFLGSDQHRVSENKRNKRFLSWRNYFIFQVHNFTSAQL